MKLRPDVLVVASSLGAVAARKIDTATPVVFVGVSDPVQLGLVTNLARPGGNMTGLSRVFDGRLLGKAIQLLRDIVPTAHRIAILYNPDGAVEPRVAEAEQAIRSLGLAPLPVKMRDAGAVDAAFAAMRAQRADSLLVITDPLTLSNRDAIVKAAAQSRIPTVYEFAEFARAGGLIAYSASVPALFERAAIYVDKILKGASSCRPAGGAAGQVRPRDQSGHRQIARIDGTAVAAPACRRGDPVSPVLRAPDGYGILRRSLPGTDGRSEAGFMRADEVIQ